MSEKHTPGPWVFEPGKDNAPEDDSVQTGCALGAIVGDGYFIARVWGDVGADNVSDPGNSSEANARLITAAPDYDAVAREMASFRDAGKPVPARVWQKLYDTIAKAEGAK